MRNAAQTSSLQETLILLQHTGMEEMASGTSQSLACFQRRIITEKLKAW
jgi:hypothetical protein